jgi:hypothetical protein
MPLIELSNAKPGLYGDGNQGTVVFDGTTTILGLIPASNIYTMTAEINATTITNNSGSTIKPLGFVIHCADTLNNAGIIHSNGNDASGSTGGLIISATGNLGCAGASGGDGRSTTGAGSNGNGAGARNITGGGAGGAGGAAGGPNAGGTGNTTVAPTAVQGTMRTASNILKSRLWDGTTGNSSGGGGGGGVVLNSGTATSGGGGGAGIPMVIYCKKLNNTGTISSNGGTGATAVVTGNAVAGGGGGGAGGYLAIFTEEIIALGTITANGGTAGGGLGTGVGSAVKGNKGTVLIFTPQGTMII